MRLKQIVTYISCIVNEPTIFGKVFKIFICLTVKKRDAKYQFLYVRIRKDSVDQ